MACGGDDGDGGSGVPDSTALPDVPASELVALCEEMAALWPARDVTCGAETISWGVDGDCSNAQNEPAPAECADVTVGDVRDCFGALGALSDADVCTQVNPPAACDVLFASPCFATDMARISAAR